MNEHLKEAILVVAVCDVLPTLQLLRKVKLVMMTAAVYTFEKEEVLYLLAHVLHQMEEEPETA